jgi:hypothetical protein
VALRIGSTHFASFFVHPAFSRISDALSSGSASGQNLDRRRYCESSTTTPCILASWDVAKGCLLCPVR